MEKTKFMGVYFRNSTGERKKGKKVDSCFYITYRKKGEKQLIWEKVGWAGEGYSPKLASQVRAERLRMIRHGQELPRERQKIPRFSEMSKLYLDWVKENKSRDKDDKGRYENHLKDFLGKKKLNEISSFDLEHLKADLTKKNLAPATVKHCLVLVREIFNKAREWGKYQGENPIKGVKMPTLNNQRERFLSHEEADKLLTELKEVSRSVHDQALLSLHCGLRAGEIFNLRGQHIDLENELIRIIDPKNKANRAAYMTHAVKEMLKARLPKNLNDLIFKDRWHKERIELVSRTFQRTIDSLGFNNGVEDPRQRVVFHSLRHTFASWLAIQGTPLLTIKELLGHKTLSMTVRYAHLIPDMKRDATLALEAGFESSRIGKSIPIELYKECSVT